MIIKFAQPEDLCEIDDLYRGYLSPVKFDQHRVAEALKGMIALNSVIVAVVDDKIVGVLAGYFFPSLINSDIYFVTMFSFFREKHRRYAVRFFQRIDEILETTQATKFFVGVPFYQDQKKMDRFYRMKGFTPCETHYVKDVKRKESQDAV